MRLSCFGCEKKNGRTVGGTFYSFQEELLGAFHLGKKSGNFGGSKSETSDW